MLVRSQNRENLWNLENLSGITYNESCLTRYGKEKNEHQISVDFGGLLECCGVYVTKERAIEVLDMIENYYQYAQEWTVTGTGKKQPGFVFQMPEK